MPQQPQRHNRSSQSHARVYQNVFVLDEVLFLAVVPSAVVEKLAQNLDRRLRPVFFLRGHVQVFDQNVGVFVALGRHDSFFEFEGDFLFQQVANVVCRRFAVENEGVIQPLFVEFVFDVIINHQRFPRRGVSEQKQREFVWLGNFDQGQRFDALLVWNHDVIAFGDFVLEKFKRFVMRTFQNFVDVDELIFVEVEDEVMKLVNFLFVIFCEFHQFFGKREILIFHVFFVDADNFIDDNLTFFGILQNPNEINNQRINELFE
jgi:hypothetical protein